MRSALYIFILTWFLVVEGYSQEFLGQTKGYVIKNLADDWRITLNLDDELRLTNGTREWFFVFDKSGLCISEAWGCGSQCKNNILTKYIEEGYLSKVDRKDGKMSITLVKDKIMVEIRETNDPNLFVFIASYTE